jgi:hypothetical protein
MAFMIQPYQTEIKFQISGDILGVLSAVFALSYISNGMDRFRCTPLRARRWATAQ